MEGERREKVKTGMILVCLFVITGVAAMFAGDWQYAANLLACACGLLLIKVLEIYG